MTKTATDLKLMHGSPPPPNRRVTLKNWYIGAPIRWSFKNIPQLIPCAEAHRGPGPTTLLPRANKQFTPNLIQFKTHDGRSNDIGTLLEQTYTDALLIVHRGEIVHETYVDMVDYQRHLLQSVSKSLTACLFAVLAEKGLVDPQQTVAHYLPSFASSAYGDATLQQVLDMTASVEYDETYEDMQSDVNLHSIAGGWYGHVDRTGPFADVAESLYDYLPTLTTKSSYPHGKQFHYVSANTDVLGLIIEKVGNRPFTHLFQEHIWQHLGAEENAAMTVDPWGCAFPCGGFNITTRDLARFGLMALGNGKYNGRQIVPAAFFADTLANGSRKAWLNGEAYETFMPGGSYRNQFWVTGNDHNAFFGIGIHGQYLYIDPTAEMVIVKFSSHPTADDYDLSAQTIIAFHAIGKQLVQRP